MADLLQSRPHIVIVGGGIGGFSAALACARRGMTVHVLERAPEIKEIGAGLQLGPNAGRALAHLGVQDAVMRTAVLPTRFVMLDVYTGAELYQAELGQKFAERFGAPYTVMHRADLLNALIEGCESTGLVEATPGKEVVSLDQVGDGASITCADGAVYHADVAVGADGLRSVVRSLILDDSEPVTSQYVIYRGPGKRPEGTEDAVMLYAGDELHLMQYPIQGGNLLNRVVSFKSRAGEPGSDTWGTPEELDEKFAHCCDHVREALQNLDRETRWVQYDRRPLAGWTQGRVALLGDAAHPMRQYLAQGAGQAMEDAVALADCLAEAPDQLPAALERYEAVRFPRAAAVQTNTRFFGELVHLGGAGAIVRDGFLRSLSPNDYDAADWLYGIDPPPAPVVPSHVDFYATS